ncbi:hypothetical protein MRX96_010816 [Rhipicephalus microplus]
MPGLSQLHTGEATCNTCFPVKLRPSRNGSEPNTHLLTQSDSLLAIPESTTALIQSRRHNTESKRNKLSPRWQSNRLYPAIQTPKHPSPEFNISNFSFASSNRRQVARRGEDTEGNDTSMSPP